MLTKKQFLSLYNEAHFGIKQLKHTNDKINRSIGSINQSKLYKETDCQKQIMQNLQTKIQSLINKLQENYLDPDTARKIGSTKQQFRIQKDRRIHLIQAANQALQQYNQRQRPPPEVEEQRNRTNQKSKKTAALNSSIEMESSDYYNLRKTNQGDNETNQSTHNSTKMQSQLTDYDYEIEGRMLHEKNKELKSSQERMVHINSIMDQTQNMVEGQGTNLDIIGEQLFAINKNVSDANRFLKDANQKSKKSKKKYFIFLFMVFLIVGGLIAFTYGIK